jgi:plastocyanin
MNMPPSATASSGSYGNGATHTVWVAPTQGVLRYVPFAVNASVGDTVKFIWGANNHTVTKSSELDVCNKTGDQPFASGEQNKTFVCKNHTTLFLHSSQKLTTVSPSHANGQRY